MPARMAVRQPLENFLRRRQSHIDPQPQPLRAGLDWLGQRGQLIEVGPIRQLAAIPMKVVGRNFAERHLPVKSFPKGGPLQHGGIGCAAEPIAASNRRQHGAGRLRNHVGLDVAHANGPCILVETADDKPARRRQPKTLGGPGSDWP